MDISRRKFVKQVSAALLVLGIPFVVTDDLKSGIKIEADGMELHNPVFSQRRSFQKFGGDEIRGEMFYSSLALGASVIGADGVIKSKEYKFDTGKVEYFINYEPVSEEKFVIELKKVGLEGGFIHG